YINVGITSATEEKADPRSSGTVVSYHLSSLIDIKCYSICAARHIEDSINSAAKEKTMHLPRGDLSIVSHHLSNLIDVRGDSAEGVRGSDGGITSSTEEKAI